MPPTEVVSTKITSNPPRHGTGRVMSVHVAPVIYDAALKSAELLGCSSISEFVRDAICEKIETTMRAVGNIARKNMSTYKVTQETELSAEQMAELLAKIPPLTAKDIAESDF